LRKNHHFLPKAAQMGGTFPPHFKTPQPQQNIQSQEMNYVV
jgi:hypothetical protein